jgi:hypothetical protein
MSQESASLSRQSFIDKGSLIAVVIAFVGLFGYSIHERSIAQQLVAENQQTTSALQQTRGQIDALSAKLDAISGQRTATAEARTVAPAHHGQSVRRVAVRHTGKPDPRWKKFQNQLDAQGQTLDAQGKIIEGTRQDLASARTELGSGIAKNHQELVVLQRKGERNFFEFDIDKSKQFSHTGPVGVSLRKANTKHMYADLELMVEDRDISKKHLNLFEPATFYPDGEHQPIELVVNRISKNHIHGYISVPKYRGSELTAMNSSSDGSTSLTDGNNASSTALQLRHRSDTSR